MPRNSCGRRIRTPSVEPQPQAAPAPVGELAGANPAGAPDAQSGVPTDMPSDPEMLQVFLEEAREVLHAIAGELDALAQQPSNSERLGVVRRGFHTLKGSGRMVELNHLGEAAWAVEQVLNGVLQRAQPAGADLLRLLRLALMRLDDWIGQLERLGRAGIDSGTLLDWAERVKRGEPLPQDDEPVAKHGSHRRLRAAGDPERARRKLPFRRRRSRSAARQSPQSCSRHSWPRRPSMSPRSRARPGRCTTAPREPHPMSHSVPRTRWAGLPGPSASRL